MASTTHYLKLPDRLVALIQSGKKIMDARPIAGIYAPILVGDHIRYNRDADVTVKKINIYGSMRELLVHEGWENLVPDASGPDDAYRQLIEGLAPGEEKLPTKVFYFNSMEAHWFKYWFRKSGKEQV
jgi:ASC-1-like (ASCH) protein